MVILHLPRQIGVQARRRASPHATPVQAQPSERPCFVCRLVCCEGRLCFPRPRCFAPRIRVPGKSSSRSRMAGLPEPLSLLQARLASVPSRCAPGPPRVPPHQPGSLDSSSCSCEHGAFQKHTQPIRRPLTQQCCRRPVISWTGAGFLHYVADWPEDVLWVLSQTLEALRANYLRIKLLMLRWVPLKRFSLENLASLSEATFPDWFSFFLEPGCSHFPKARSRPPLLATQPGDPSLLSYPKTQGVEGKQPRGGRGKELCSLLSACSLPFLLPSRGLQCSTLEALKHLLESFMDARCSVDYPGAGVPS